MIVCFLDTNPELTVIAYRPAGRSAKKIWAIGYHIQRRSILEVEDGNVHVGVVSGARADSNRRQQRKAAFWGLPFHGFGLFRADATADECDISALPCGRKMRCIGLDVDSQESQR